MPAPRSMPMPPHQYHVASQDAPRASQAPWRAPGPRLAAKPLADASTSLAGLGRGREHLPGPPRPSEHGRWGEEPGWRADPKPRDGWVNREGNGEWRAQDSRGGDEWRADRWKLMQAAVGQAGEPGGEGGDIRIVGAQLGLSAARQPDSAPPQGVAWACADLQPLRVSVEYPFPPPFTPSRGLHRRTRPSSPPAPSRTPRC